MALNTFKCNCLTPLHFKGLIARHVGWKRYVVIVEIYEQRAKRPIDWYMQAVCGVVANYKVRCRLCIACWCCRCCSGVVVCCCCCRANRLRRARRSRWNTLPRLLLPGGGADCCALAAVPGHVCCWRWAVSRVMTSSAASRSILSSISAISRSRRSILLHTSVVKKKQIVAKVCRYILDFK